MDIYIIISRRVNPRSVNTLHINCLLLLLPRWLREQSSSDRPSQPASPSSQHSHPVGRVVMCLGVEHGWMWWILSTKGDGKIHSTKLTFGYLWECSFHFHFPGWHGVGRLWPECAPCQPRMKEAKRFVSKRLCEPIHLLMIGVGPVPHRWDVFGLEYFRNHRMEISKSMLIPLFYSTCLTLFHFT